MKKYILNKIKQYRIYKYLKKTYRFIFPENNQIPVNVKYYPIDLNIEITTRCNSKCDSCTRDNVIRLGDRPLKEMSLEFAKSIIDRLKEMTVTNNTPQDIVKFSPVGLGEPLLHPDFFKIIAYARNAFPKALIHMNTNGIFLTPEIAKCLIESDIDYMYISLGYNNTISYKNHMGVDKYDLVCSNIKTLLKLKGSNKPKVLIHNFDVSENRNSMKYFNEYWSPFLNSNDSVILYPYVEFKNFKQSKKAEYPCNNLWNVMMIDVEGSIYPCCAGVWKKYDKSLCLGKIKDNNTIIFDKLKKIRQNHLDKNFGTCLSCAVLYSSEKANELLFKELGH